MNNYGLNRTYRPQTFEEVCGQNITVTILKKVIENRNFKNCYLFAGASGTGKTTCARIFANAINRNVGSPIEIDAASNNSVDDVRMIVEAANQRAIEGEYKIYIVDEAHMLTTAAWNAFLKTLEEPPKYTIFIFCTTDPNKIPVTILNRLQRYNFTKVPIEVIKNRLLYICEQEHFINYETACDFISKISDGGMRTAITYLEQCADYSKDLSIDNIKSVLGGSTFERKLRLTYFMMNKNEAAIIGAIETLYNEGCDLKNFISSYLDFALDLNKYILFKNINLTNIPAYLENIDIIPSVKCLTNEANSLDFIDKLVELLLNIKVAIKNDLSYKSTIEAMLIKFIRG